MEDLDLDHFVQLSWGGASEVPNCLPACTRCHKRKRDKDPCHPHYWRNFPKPWDAYLRIAEYTVHHVEAAPSGRHYLNGGAVLCGVESANTTKQRRAVRCGRCRTIVAHGFLRIAPGFEYHRSLWPELIPTKPRLPTVVRGLKPVATRKPATDYGEKEDHMPNPTIHTVTVSAIGPFRAIQVQDDLCVACEGGPVCWYIAHAGNDEEIVALRECTACGAVVTTLRQFYLP